MSHTKVTPKINVVENDKHSYPELKRVVGDLDHRQRGRFKVWLQSTEGIDCSHSKAYHLSKGTFKGTTLEKERIASYFNRSEKTLFKQS
jgi:hypothetical protein